MPVKIAVLGDYAPSHITLKAINDTFGPLKKLLNKDIRFDWFDTDKIGNW